jgi:hypothetical protein
MTRRTNDKIDSSRAEAEDTEQSRVTADTDATPPDGGYGWVCVACTFTINCFTWGMVSTYGVYLADYLSNDTFPEARPLDYAFVVGLSFGAAMLAAPFVTVIVRIWGIKAAMYPGTLMIGGGFVAASFASSIWQLYLSQGILVGLGVGFLYIPGINILSQWFSAKRTLANGISAAGSGIGGLSFSFAAGAMIRNLSLAWSLRITGMTAFSCNLAAAIFVKDRNAQVQPKQRPFDVNLLRRKEVAFLLAWAFLSMLGYITLLFSMSDFALSIGLSRNQATQVTAFLNMGTALIRPFIGVAGDRFGRFEVASGLTFATGLLCFAVWIPATSFGVTVFFAIVSGGILGVFWMVCGLHQLFSRLTSTDHRTALCGGCWTQRAPVIAIPFVVNNRNARDFLRSDRFVHQATVLVAAISIHSDLLWPLLHTRRCLPAQCIHHLQTRSTTAKHKQLRDTRRSVTSSIMVV